MKLRRDLKGIVEHAHAAREKKLNDWRRLDPLTRRRLKGGRGGGGRKELIITRVYDFNVGKRRRKPRRHPARQHSVERLLPSSSRQLLKDSPRDCGLYDEFVGRALFGIQGVLFA